jgi:hypothetical protein
LEFTPVPVMPRRVNADNPHTAKQAQETFYRVPAAPGVIVEGPEDGVYHGLFIEHFQSPVKKSRQRVYTILSKSEQRKAL